MALTVIAKNASLNLSVQPKTTGLKVQPKSLLEEIRIKAGWDEINSKELNKLFNYITTKDSIDIDIFASVYDKNNSLLDVCYFGNKSIYNQAIVHSGDNLTGKDDPSSEKIPSSGLKHVDKSLLSVDEEIIIKLQQLPSEVCKLIIGLNIYKAKDRNQSFDSIKNCFMAIADGDNLNQALIDISNKEGNGFIAIKIVKNSNQNWVITNLDHQFNGDIRQIVSACSIL